MDPAERSHEIDEQRQVYQPIGVNQLRVLRIHPSANQGAHIVADLIVVDLKEKSSATLAGTSKVVGYEALSYTWGDPEPTDRTLINGRPFWISKNLVKALEQFRVSSRERFVWVDAVCINQIDIPEKSAQVSMMFSIYAKAFRVVVWLGDATPTDDQVFALTKKYEKEGCLSRTFGADPKLVDAATSLIKSKPWFQRSWIRQEVHAAREVHISCGTHSASYDTFSYVMDTLLPDIANERDIFRPHRDPAEQPLRARALYMFFKQHCDPSYHDMFQRHYSWTRLIMRGTMYDATLPQDKVYAALGTIAQVTKSEGHYEGERADSTEGFPSLDYSKSVSVVYQEFVKHAVNVSGDLNCLEMFQSRDAIGDDLPSWAIDLRLNVTRLHIRLGVFTFGSNDSTAPEQDYSDLGVLRLEGRKIGTIMTSPAPWARATDCSMRREYNSDTFGSWSSGVTLESPFSNEEWWMPENQENKGVEEVLKILEKRCSYSWVSVALEKDCVEEYEPEEHVCYAFVSSHVEHGDILIHASGSNYALALHRESTGGQYSFIGPVLLAVGRVRGHKDKQIFTYAFPRSQYYSDAETFFVL